MRIGFDARVMRYRGISTYSRNLLRHFAASGLEVVVFCQDQEKEALPWAENLSLVSANLDPLAPHTGKAFRALVEKSGVDLLHVPSPWAPVPLAVPLVATVHDVTPLLYRRSLPPVLRFRYRRRLERVLREARHIITVSNISLSTLIAYGGVEPAKVSVIHNGVSERFRPDVSAEARAAVRHRYLLPDRFVLWAGDFRPEKNLSFLIEAWARLSARSPEIPALVLAGSQSGEYRKLKKEVEKRGLVSRVLFPGLISDEDMPAVYSAATLFVFPSLHEGFGLPPLEAMACGTPCVVSDSSSLPEVTGPAALRFNPTSLEQFQECVLRVLNDRELYESLREAGLRWAANFVWERAAGQTIRVYERVLRAQGTT